MFSSFWITITQHVIRVSFNKEIKRRKEQKRRTFSYMTKSTHMLFHRLPRIYFFFYLHIIKKIFKRLTQSFLQKKNTILSGHTRKEAKCDQYVSKIPSIKKYNTVRCVFPSFWITITIQDSFNKETQRS